MDHLVFTEKLSAYECRRLRARLLDNGGGCALFQGEAKQPFSEWESLFSVLVTSFDKNVFQIRPYRQVSPETDRLHSAWQLTNFQAIPL